MAPIQRIRADVMTIRHEHRTLEGGPWKGRCAKCDVFPVGPCPTLKLAEDKLRLAEAVLELTGWLDVKSPGHQLADRVLAECAHEGT